MTPAKFKSIEPPEAVFCLIGRLKTYKDEGKLNNKNMENKKYVDGFLLVVPKDRVEDYKKMAEGARKTWLKHGALDYKECMGEDLNPKPPEGMPADMPLPRSFVELLSANSSETVWFSYIVFKSREHRDQVNAKVMKDMEKEMKDSKDMPMPFDMEKVFYGGFSVEIGD